MVLVDENDTAAALMDIVFLMCVDESWQGLDPQVGSTVPVYSAVSGSAGLAMHYSHEPQ